MKIPCEIVVWYALPTVRKEVAKELVSTHGCSQADVARMFGVTDAAISQYLKDKRGDNKTITSNPNYSMVQKVIKEVAEEMVKNDAEFAREVCKICLAIKDAGILAKIYEVEFGTAPPACSTCRSQILSP